MPSLEYKDLKLSIGVFGSDVHVQIRTLDLHMTEQELLEMVYPIFDAKEKTLTPGQR
jgi:hypothetical protein